MLYLVKLLLKIDILAREHASDVLPLAFRGKENATQAPLPAAERGRVEVDHSCGWVGQVAGTLPRYQIAARRKCFSAVIANLSKSRHASAQADVFVVQRQQNLMFRAFGIWHSKTRVSVLHSYRRLVPNTHSTCSLCQLCASMPITPSSRHGKSGATQCQTHCRPGKRERSTAVLS